MVVARRRTNPPPRIQQPATTLQDVLLRRGFSPDQIAAMPAARIFDEYCVFLGLGNYGPELRAVMDAARRHEETQK